MKYLRQWVVPNSSGFLVDGPFQLQQLLIDAYVQPLVTWPTYIYNNNQTCSITKDKKARIEELES